MFYDAPGSTGLHGTANTYNWIQDGLLTQSLSSDQGNHMTLFEALTHTVEVCKTATSAWTNTGYAAQTGSPTVKFNATPSGNNINSVMGLSNGAQSIYTSLPRSCASIRRDSLMRTTVRVTAP